MKLLEKLDMEGLSSGAVIGPAVHALLSGLDAPADLAVPTSVSTTIAIPLPGVLGSSFTGSVTVTATAGAGPVTLALALDGATVLLPPAAKTATRTVAGTGQRRRIRYADAGGPVGLMVSGNLLIRLDPGAEASVDVSQLSIAPTTRTVLLPAGIGLTLPQTFAALAGRFRMLGTEFVLPEAVPVIGGVACVADLQCGAGRLDLDLAVAPAPVEAGQDAPAIGGTLSWHIPDADSFAQLVPTAVSMTLDLPQGSGLLGPDGPVVPESLRVRAGASRPPDDPGGLSITVTVESDAAEGLLRVVDDTPGAIAAGITTVLAPAIRAGSSTAATGALLATARAIGDELAREGGYVLHGVTLDAATRRPGAVHALIDIEGVVKADFWRTGPLGVGMTDGDRPMRVRWRNVAATVDPTQPATQMLSLDFSQARIEVVDPGTWTVATPGSLLDIVGTRSGHGSTWFEVDLRFVVDLGPVKVSGATIRVTFDEDGIALGLRGLVASIEVPGLLTGDGAVAFTDTGFSVVLGIELPPVGIAALGFLRFDDLPGGRKVEIGFAVDLPGPLPLGPTGLGLYGVIGTFGYNARMRPLPPDDPFTELRRWKPWNPLDFGAGDVTIGMGVSIGTAPDNGFLFSALAVLGITVPDFALRIGVDGTLLAVRRTITRTALDELEGRVGAPPGLEITVFGGVSSTPQALDLAVAGEISVPLLLEIDVPVAGHFPNGSADWWLRVGSDDGAVAPTGRAPGHIRARVFPGTPFECSGWGFLMVHGGGIRAPGLMGSPPEVAGFAIGVGAGVEVVIGAKGILWAEITAGFWALISTRPQLLRATGHLSGKLGIGPFSVGLSATATVQIWTDASGEVLFAYKLRVCGEIDLLFDTLRKCITIDTLEAATQAAPEPTADDWPWPEVLLADGLGRSLPAADGGEGAPQRPAEGSGDTPADGWSKAPVVWPDVVPVLSFPIAPAMSTTAVTSPSPTVNLGLVSSGGASITWSLTDVRLEDVTDPAAITSVPIHDTSRWQVPAGTGTWPAGTSNARELVLLRRTLLAWAAHLAGDGSASKPAMDPATLIGGACAWKPIVGPGWAVGKDATPIGGDGAWHVPPERREWGPSFVGAFADGTGFTIGTIPVARRGLIAPGVPAATAAMGPHDFPGEATAAGRRFDHGLRLRSSMYPVAGQELRMRTTLVLDEPVVGGSLHLLVAFVDAEEFFGVDGITASARTVGGAPVTLSVTEGERSDDGSAVVAVITLPDAADDPIARIQVELPWGRPASLLGLLSTTARDAASGHTGSDAQSASNTADGEGAADPAKLSQLLHPGRRYRLSVSLAWSSALNVAGVTAAPASGGPEVRSWYFATAGKDPAPPPKPTTAQQKQALVASGAPLGYAPSMTLVATGKPVATTSGLFVDIAKAAALFLDTFKPDYLARYVKGFTPADRTEFMFPGDQPGIEFLAMHIVELAGLYDRDVGLLVRRVDRPAPDLYTVPFPQPATSKLKLPLAAAVKAVAQEVGCVILPTESTLRVAQTLEKGASYELSCVLPEAGDTPDKWTPSLGGITFTTSNFADPAELIDSFGFRAGSPSTGRVHGDLRVAPVELPAGVLRDDAELERTIDALGLPPLRPVGANRSSLLWTGTADAGWSLAGLLLESTEPLVRDDDRRMSLGQVTIGGTELRIRRLDRAATVALWLTPQPISITSPTTIIVRATDASVPFSRAAVVSAPPRFASTTMTVVEEP